MFHHLTLGRPYWDLLSVESFLRRNSIYTTEQAINAMFRRLDHDDDKQLSYAEFREALNSHLTYPHSYVPLIRETVIRSSPYRASPGLRSSVYASPYWATAAPLISSYQPVHWSPYRSYYPDYVSPARYRAPMVYESPMEYYSPHRSHLERNLDMPYAQHPDTNLRKEEQKLHTPWNKGTEEEQDKKVSKDDL